jgi:hypothetical protein
VIQPITLWVKRQRQPPSLPENVNAGRELDNRERERRIRASSGLLPDEHDWSGISGWDAAGAPGGPSEAEPGAGSAGRGAAQRRSPTRPPPRPVRPDLSPLIPEDEPMPRA